MRPGQMGRSLRDGRLAELAAGVLVDHREHRVAHGAPPAVTAAQEARVQERLERVEVCVAHRLGRGKSKTAREDREPGEELPLIRLQKLIAPVERGTQRPLPRRCVARPSGEQAKPLLEPLQEHLRGHEAQPRGGELHSERKTVEAAADLGGDGIGDDGRPVTVLLGAEAEEPNRLRLRERRDLQDALRLQPAAAPDS